MNTIPLVPRQAQEAFARRGDQVITVGEFCADVQAVADQLPPCRHLVNLCQDRYLFTATFFAAISRGQTNLLPAKRDPADIISLADRYPQTIIVSEQNVDRGHRITLEPGQQGTQSSPEADPGRIAAIAFTSGSTGEPQAHPKSWQMLDTWRRIHLAHLPDSSRPQGVVATVPSWHMYGLEWAMLLPTLAPVTLFCGADFYPQDVMQAVAGLGLPTLLITTPVHLRALVKSSSVPDNINTVMSATAPLANDLVQQTESLFQADLLEIYGCSEIGSLAYRYPRSNEHWHFFDAFEISSDQGELVVDHPLLLQPVMLADAFSRHGKNSYQLLGRATDLIKVAGKRESLAHLNNILLSIPGIEDGVIYQPDHLGLGKSERLAALAVAPDLDAGRIRRELAQRVQTAFIPRPIQLVDKLPRDSTSKLKHHALRALVRGLAET